MREHSLINSVPENAVDADYSMTKIAAVVVSVIIFAAAFGYFLNQLNFICGLIAAFFFLAVFTLQAFFIKDRSVIIAAVFVETAVLALPFYKILSLPLIIAFFTFFLLNSGAILFGQRELENALKIPFFKISKAILVKSIIYVILLVSSIFIFSEMGAILFTEKNSQAFINPLITPIIRPIAPNFSPEMPVGVLISEIVKEQMRESEQFKAMSEAEESAYLDKVVKEEAKIIERTTGAALDLKKSVADNIYLSLSSLLDNLTPQDKNYFGIALLVFIWLTISGFVFIFYVPVAILTYILYEILLAADFAVIQYESRSREIIILK